MVRRFLMALALSAMTTLEVAAQAAFPAPLPSEWGGAPSVTYPPATQQSSPFPSAGSAAASQGSFPAQGAAPLGGGLAAGGFGGGGGGAAEQQACMAKFAPLRRDAEERAALIKAASERKAPPQEACKLLKDYVQAEAGVVNYVKTRQTACGIPAEIAKQLKANQARSQEMMRMVCKAAGWPQPPIKPKPLRIAAQKALEQ